MRPIDLLRGALGNNTPLGKQLTNIRKQVTKRRHSKDNAEATTAVTPAKLKA